MPTGHQIFICYSGENQAAGEAVERALEAANLRSWRDRSRLPTGCKFNPKIDEAIDSSYAAILVVSEHFLASDFIKNTEMPRLAARMEKGELVIFPVLADEVKLGGEGHWLNKKYKIQIRQGSGPFGALDADAQARELERAIADLTVEVARNEAERISVTLMERALLKEELPQEEARVLARNVVQELIKCLRGLEAKAKLVDATRFCIEYHLLCEEELGAIRLYRAVECLFKPPPYSFVLTDKEQNGLDDFKKKARACKYTLTLHDAAMFFSRTRGRETQWKRYFRALLELANCTCREKKIKKGRGCLPCCYRMLLRSFSQATMASLTNLTVSGGFVAPQYLLAGLLSRFDDDWQPVLQKYWDAAGGRPYTPERTSRASEHREILLRRPFRSVQATQWTCWLVWGPSIPICSCEMWRGSVAYQFGMGDENNSLPVYERWKANDGPGLIEKSLDQDTDLIRARRFKLTGRLRWAPRLLRLDPDLVPPTKEVSGEDTRAFGATAQRALFEEDILEATKDRSKDVSDGLVFSAEKGEEEEGLGYFSAYLWVMFLVKQKAPPGKDKHEVVRLGGAWLPQLHPKPTLLQIETIMRDLGLWRDLLPVFIHANIADPLAFEVQRGVLIETCVQLLRSLWANRESAFEPHDCDAQIRFEVVSSSDYTGCGCPLRHEHEPKNRDEPKTPSLVELLKKRLEGDALEEAVIFPDKLTGADPSRPPALREYYSACRLPDLVGAYIKGAKQDLAITDAKAGHL